MANPAAPSPSSDPSLIEQLTDRVERLLLRHAEVQRTNELLLGQVYALTEERDALKSRLGTARARIDALLERLPSAASQSEKS